VDVEPAGEHIVYRFVADARQRLDAPAARVRIVSSHVPHQLVSPSPRLGGRYVVRYFSTRR
jgi:hypothetical protein